MALDRLTKIDGGGISTTSDYRVGVITATKFVGPIEGSITATDATFSGNVSIAGTLTYEDVINVDSVGIGTFREGIFLPDNKKLQFGNAAGSADLEIFHSSSENKTIIDNNTNDLDIASDVIRLKNSARSETLATFIGNGGVSLYYDNSIKLGTAGWGIQATGILKIADATNSSGATNHLALGASNDLKLFHDGSHNRIHGSTGFLDINNSADLISITASNRIDISDDFIRLRSRDGSDVYMTGTVNSSVDLYFNGSKKFETLSSGVQVTGTFAELVFNCLNGTGKQYKFRASGTNSTGFELWDITLNQRAYLYHDNTYLGGVHHFHTNGTLRFAIEGANVNIANDTTRLRIGASADLQIYHDGSNSYISDSGTGALTIEASTLLIENAAGNQNMIQAHQSGAVNLYYANSKKFETTSAGITVTGSATASTFAATNNVSAGGNIVLNSDTGRLRIGASNDLELFHNGSNSYIQDNGTGALLIGSGNSSGAGVYIRGKHGEESIIANSNGSVDLYYDNTKRFETTSAGVNIVGTTTTTQLAVTGISTFTGMLNANGDMTITSPSPTINFTENNGDPDYRIFLNGGIFTIDDVTNNIGKFSITSSRITLNDTVLLNDNIVYIGDKLVHWTDDDTMIRFPAADQIQFETAGTSWFNLGSTGAFNFGNNSNAGAKVYIKNGNDDANNTNALALDIQGAWMRIGDAILGDETFNNGVGIKFHNSGTVHWTAGMLGSGFYISNTSNNGNQLFPSTRVDAFFLSATGNATFSNNATVSGDLSVTGTTALSSTVTIPDSIQHDGDTNTKIRFPAADTISFETAGTERLRITSAGRVGIGSDTPVAHLDVANYQNIEVLRLRDRHFNKYLTIRGGGSPNRMVIDSYEGDGGGAAIDLASNGDTKLRIDSSGRVLIGTTTEGFAEADDLTINSADHGGITIRTPTNKEGNIAFSDTTSGTGEYSGLIRYRHSNNDLGLWTNSNLRLLIDSNGRSLFSRGGLTASRNVGTKTGEIQVANSGNSSAISLIGYSNDVGGPHLMFGKSRAGNATGSTILQSGDRLGEIGFCGADGNDIDSFGAAIKAHVDGTPGTNDMPGRLELYTTPDGSSSAVERLRITSMGDVYAGNEAGYAIFDNSTIRPRFQFRQGTGTNRGFALIETRGDAASMSLYLAKSREGPGTGLINAGDQLGSIQFTGADGTNQVTGAQILAYTQSTKTVSTDRMPTNLSFYTHDDNTSGKVERLRIFHDGRIAMSKNGWTGNDASFALTVHTGSTSDGGNAVNDGIMIVSQNNNGNQNSTTGKLMFCGHAQTNGPFIYAKNAQAYGKKDLVFHTRSTANDYTTQVAETFRITYQGNVGINEPAPDSQLVVRATSDDNPGIKLYRQSGGGDTASIAWASSVGTNAQINYRGGSGDEGLQFRTSIGNGNQGSTKERFRINHGDTQGVNIYVMNESDNAPTGDVTALLIQNGIGGGDIGPDSRPTHIDWAWFDANPNDRPQCRISGNVGNGGDPNSLALEGKGFLTFHCSDTNSSSYNDIDPPQRLRIAHNGTFTGSSSNNISDQRLKENIATITDPIAKIKALKGRTFTWKTEASMREGTHYGFIAQEVETVIPDLIVEDTGIRLFDKDDNLLPSNVITPPVGGGYAKSVDADGVTPVLVEALKEALVRIETLEAEVAALKSS